MIVLSSAPESSGKMRCASTARPMLTPACGISARPRYRRTPTGMPVMCAPIQEPRNLPAMRTAKYAAPMMPTVVREFRSRCMPLRTKNMTLIGGVTRLTCLKSVLSPRTLT